MYTAYFISAWQGVGGVGPDLMVVNSRDKS